MKKILKLIILCFIFGLLLYGQNALAACPAKPAGCTATDCYTGGYCGCDLSTTSDYSCMNKSNGTNCVEKLCPGASNIQCCKAKTAGGGGAGNAGAGGGGAGGNLGPLLPACAATGRCSLCDLIQVAINFGEFLFGIVGALVLLYFFYGGFLMLTSAGEGGKVKKGKDVLVNSVIGLMIVFLAYSGVNFLVGVVTKQGWDWTKPLTGPKACAELPPPFQWSAPSAGQGAGGPPGGSPVVGGQTVDTTKTCTTLADCTPGFCSADSKCKDKLAGGSPCSDALQKGGTAKDMCSSGTCGGDGKCTGPASAGTACTEVNTDKAPCDPASTFCNGSACIAKREAGKQCTLPVQCINGVCTGTHASPGYCVAQNGTEPDGSFCTLNAQCLSGHVCVALTAKTAPTGNCRMKLGNGTACWGLGFPHMPGAANQDSDNAICDAHPGYTGYCRETLGCYNP